MTRSRGLTWARSCNLKTFLATERMKDKLNHFTPCACAQGKTHELALYYDVMSNLLWALPYSLSSLKSREKPVEDEVNVHYSYTQTIH